MLEFCKVERDEHLLLVTLNRPDVMNALHRPANLELEKVFNDFSTDPELWVCIVTGAGDKAFSAGNDLKYLAAGNDATVPPSGFGGLTARFDLDKPVIAAVNGLALGGGFEIALACDIIVAAENASFGLPEPRVGLAATAGGLLRLTRQIPVKQAMSMILTGRSVTAEEGLRLGFVNEVTPEGACLERAKSLAREIIANSPLAVRAAKHIAYRGLDCVDLETLYRAQRNLPVAQTLYGSADALEGPKAFSERRKPVWLGR
ncbi:carnitinyl-CoA dehydratase [Afipia carboxidovorans OM5]|uniref:Carnitinyl-CoA dehydratase CaiD n=1 Tax=Afipia carboxidovorans (strain ATCC 49405 / DSM 1227 / KCTC 32145 / OM5) TaxID=504832 RepID=B6JBR4_AFIC5|nr:enoyl-CoA hydratase-related protein [Afipia carboxidovorans]ACI92130.1 carnitinyl-CoA dehydratase [Afipia carboxidovorans OM5]AEI04030.1 carnitinyl-CoA dehydratase CaiD [Afipia carboxidovorans OM4]AEI07654.1 carnitinyl-CoA dehydratase CaiD [Afipia carboxidovorans OM5]